MEFYPTFRLESVDPSLGVQHAFHGSPEYNAPVQPPRRQGLHFEKYNNSLPPAPTLTLTLTLTLPQVPAAAPACLRAGERHSNFTATR